MAVDAVTQQAGNLSPSQFANQTWAALVLVLVGAPVTPNNLSNMMDWMTHENAADTWTGTAGVNNPLNNGLGSGGGSGLGSYPDLFTAAVYAAKGIEGGIFSPVCGGKTPGGIAAALKADAPFPVFKDAVIKSGWASGCYSGWTSHSVASVPVVTVAQAAQHSTTNHPSVGNVTAADLGDPGLLQQAEQGVATTGTTAEKAAKAATAWTGELGTLLGDLTSANWWKRVGVFVGGLTLVAAGIVIFISTTKTGQKVESDALEAGAVAAAA